MNQLIAKVKGRKKPHYYKLLSDKTIYDLDLPGLQSVDYEPDHNLDEDAWFKVADFKVKDYCIDLLSSAFVSSEYNDIPATKFSQIAFLCSIQNDNYYFQKITPSLFATRKTLSFGESVKLEKDNRRLFVNTNPDAIYIAADDTLVFKNLATISSIFKGIDSLYKEATNEELGEFLNESFIELSGSYDMQRVSKPNRKRIALAMNTLSDMSTQDHDSMLSYIHSYCENKLTYDAAAKTFSVTSDEELKFLLYGIEQRFYTTPLGQEKRLANSVQTLK
jgi:hypothetical protein